eukprot:6993538-Pyramimonas_sp.AAC.1
MSALWERACSSASFEATAFVLYFQKKQDLQTEVPNNNVEPPVLLRLDLNWVLRVPFGYHKGAQWYANRGTTGVKEGRFLLSYSWALVGSPWCARMDR